MTHHVILDADWFKVDKIRYFKKIAYFAPTLGLFGEFSLSLPPFSGLNHQDLKLQSKASHGLDWREHGDYRHDEITQAFAAMIERLDCPHLEFYAKGSEKAKLLERHLPVVIDLDKTGCPKFEELCEFKKTTLQKAIAFGQWLEWSE